VKSPAKELEYAELSRALDQLAERASALDSAELVALWPGLERRVLARARADAHDEESPLLQAEEQRIRNLAWEIGVSVDLYAVHLGALRTLANVLRERGQRVGRRSAAARRERASVPPAQSQTRDT
jgi:hypothetical protein